MKLSLAMANFGAGYFDIVGIIVSVCPDKNSLKIKIMIDTNADWMRINLTVGGLQKFNLMHCL